MKASEQQERPTTGSLARDHWDVPIRVRLLSYVGFSHWMDEALGKLEDQWSDRAAPCAKREGKSL
jgi:hypothetical protein